jgi:LAGLIDADG DNA endonuclease family
MKVLPLVGTELRSAIIGMVAGDAHIWKQKECSSVSLRIKHAERQRAYLGYKRDILQNLFKEWEIPIQSFNNSGYSGVKVETRDHPRLRVIHKWFYSGGKKRFSRQILNYLTPLGIAIWYMDDGSLSMKKREGKVHGREIHLNTYCSLEETRIIQAYFKEVWDVSWTVVLNKGLFRLRMGSNEAKKLFKIIEPYIVPMMRYKIDLGYKSSTINSARQLSIES